MLSKLLFTGPDENKVVSVIIKTACPKTCLSNIIRVVAHASAVLSMAGLPCSFT